MNRYPIPHPVVLRKILGQALPPAPLTAMIHISEYCNVRCEFCWHHSFLKKEKKQPRQMTTSETLKLIADLKKMGTEDITLSANGEPTIHPGFSIIVDTIKKYNMKLKVVTNLTIFSPVIAAALTKVNHLIVNLGAWDQTSYQAIYAPRGQVSFSKIISSIKALTRLKKGCGPIIKIGYVITKNNFQHLHAAIKIAMACNAASIRFKMMDPSSFTKSLILDDHDRKALAREIKEVLENTPCVENNLKDILNNISEPSLKEALPTHGRCFVGWFVININEDGTVTLCCQNEKLVIGNWREKPLQKIWEGEKAKIFRHSAKTKLDFEHPLWHACRTCYYCDPKHYSRSISR